ncbi:SPOSA6832_03378, partial [Sporobolomyces salmonicolor]
MSSAHKREQFLSVWPDLSKELVDYCKGENMPQEAVEWFQRVRSSPPRRARAVQANNRPAVARLQHSRRFVAFWSPRAGSCGVLTKHGRAPTGKLNRGISVVDTVEILKGSALTPDEYKKAAILGWCIELLQAYFLVADDMMDQSITRRGQPCWYRVENVGNIAINDAFMLEAAIYYLLKKHFRQEKYYVDLLELFHETTFQTELGQLIDLITAPEDHVDLSKFSLEKHHLIVVYKTAYYSFYLPVALALHMSGVQSPAAFQKALDILIPMGEYFQVQDDYLDCYGTPEQIGKIGTDILDNKCSWLINAALGKASAAQRKVLDENYGVKSSESEAKVKAVYRELELARLFEEYEAESYTRINGLINEIPEHGSDDGLQRAVFTEFLSKVYKRQKFVACPSRYEPMPVGGSLMMPRPPGNFGPVQLGETCTSH